MAKTTAARQRKPSDRTDIEKRLRRLERDGASPSQVMKALAEAGIRDLEELVRRVIGQPGARPDPIDLFAKPPERQAPRRNIVRKPPKIAFTVGNVTYDPRDIKRFAGQALCLVPRRSGTGADELFGFVGSDWLRSLMDYFRMVRIGSLAPAGASPSPDGRVGIQTTVERGGTWYYPPHTGAPVAVPIIPPTQEVPSLIARFYVDPNFEGDSISLAGDRQVPDLTKIKRGIFNLGDWNDVISSLQTGGATVLLFTDINYQDDDTLLAIPQMIYASLGLYGWDDRASSIRNWGAIY